MVNVDTDSFCVWSRFELLINGQVNNGQGVTFDDTTSVHAKAVYCAQLRRAFKNSAGSVYHDGSDFGADASA